MKTAAADAYYTPDELTARWKDAVCKGTLANWRSQGKGPPFVKVGAKVLYPTDGVHAWEAENVHASNDNNED